MKNRRKSTNRIIALFLFLAVLLVGVVGYFQYRVSADEIVRGYSSARLNFEITVPKAQSVKIKVTFTPRTGKKYYYKETTLNAANAGLNKFNYVLRKLPPDLEASVSVTSESGAVTQKAGTKTVNLPSDVVTDVGTFSLDLGQPITPTPTTTPTVAATQSQTATAAAPTITPTGSASSIALPPVPSL